jgi:hypothetical protein
MMLPLLERVVRQPGRRPLDAGVVEDHVEAAESAGGPLDQRLHIRLAADVAALRHGRPARQLDFVRRPRRGVRVDIRQHQPRPFGAEQQRRRPADA